MFTLCLPCTVGHSFIFFLLFPKLVFTLRTMFPIITINIGYCFTKNDLNQVYAEVPYKIWKKNSMKQAKTDWMAKSVSKNKVRHSVLSKPSSIPALKRALQLAMRSSRTRGLKSLLHATLTAPKTNGPCSSIEQTHKPVNLEFKLEIALWIFCFDFNRVYSAQDVTGTVNTVTSTCGLTQSKWTLHLIVSDHALYITLMKLKDPLKKKKKRPASP